MSERSPAWHLYIPKLVTVLRLGYAARDFRSDVIAGLTVAIVALPLAMALGIASGATPDKGLVTAVIAGFLISALGGSRFQIGGPTGAFVVVVLDVIARHGYDGLLLATLTAGVMLVIAGLAGLGTWIKYIPQPVITGFTAGIALIIFSTQIRDLLGLPIAEVPGEFLPKWKTYVTHLPSFTASAVAIAAVSLAIIVFLRKLAPRWPGFLIAVLVGSLLAWAFSLPVTTIGSQFGEIPRVLPAPSLPDFSWIKLKEVLPSSFTIAFLAGVESLLSAVVADSMTGRRHRSNCELVAQGVANFSSALFGGLPATGAIARTATNVRSGARSPIAGMLHALFLLAFMMLLAPLISYIPLASLAAVLVVVAWNMSEIDRFKYLMRAPAGDRLVLLLTFALTVLVDLTVAISVGVVLAAMLFMHRMAEVVAFQNRSPMIEPDRDDLQEDLRGDGESEYTRRRMLPKGVEVFELRGPLFFGVANRLNDVLDRIGPMPSTFILILRDVPLVDATGVNAVREFLERCARHQTEVIFTEMSEPVRRLLQTMGVLDEHVRTAATFEDAVASLTIASAPPVESTTHA